MTCTLTEDSLRTHAQRTEASHLEGKGREGKGSGREHAGLLPSISCSSVTRGFPQGASSTIVAPSPPTAPVEMDGAPRISLDDLPSLDPDVPCVSARCRPHPNPADYVLRMVGILGEELSTEPWPACEPCRCRGEARAVELGIAPAFEIVHALRPRGGA